MTTTIDQARIKALAERSVQLISELQHPEGAYPASPTFSAYRGYSWYRDGAFIADAMSSAGAVDSASRFFDWCQRMLEQRRTQIAQIVRAEAEGRPLPDDKMLPTRYTLDGGEGDDEWWDFQTDGYGTWVWAVVAHARRHSLNLERWGEGIRLSVDYLVATGHRSCFDWWEEHVEHVHVSTLGCVIAGLDAAASSGVLDAARVEAARTAVQAARERIAHDGVRDGHLTKWLGSTEVDGSLAAIIAPLGTIEASSPLGLASVRAIEQQLCVGNGVHRFRADTFYGGGQWPLLSCFLGLAHAAAGDRGRARELLDWAASTATDADELPEQVGEHLLAPERRAEWVERWGAIATPLLWSHAMLVRLAVELDIMQPSTHEPFEEVAR